MDPYIAIGEPMVVEARSARCSGKNLVLISLLMGLGCAVLWSQAPFGQHRAVVEPANMALTMGWKPLRTAAAGAQTRAAAIAVGQALSGRSAITPQIYSSAVNFAARDGARAGCRGNLVCTRAVGVFFGTSTGKTEEVASKIAEATGLEAKDIGDASPKDLEGYDGLIVGAPTWNTGADEQRSGTAWDDYLDELKTLSLSGKPVAVFGCGDSVSYGDNFCDAIEEIHSTFAAAGAKMLGYVDSSGYEHSESKSDQGGKFLGLALDQDNEDDQTDGRVSAWLAQIKSEGMPLD